MQPAILTAGKTGPHGGALKLHRVARFGEVSNVAAHAKKPAIPPIPRGGTALASNYLYLGVPALSACTPSQRGGARNRADRESQGLSVAQVGNLIAAAYHADGIALPFTRMITVHWQSAGVPVADMVRATGRFLDLLAKALARHGSGTAWLWVHEAGHNKGAHCHILVHVPAALVPVITRLQRGWLRRITGQPYKRRVIHSDPIGGRLGLETGNPALLALNRDNALYYVLKGANAAAAQAFDLERLEPGGRCTGKRCGTSQNIGRKARATKGTDA